MFIVQVVQATSDSPPYIKLYDGVYKKTFKLSPTHPNTDSISEIASDFLLSKGIVVLGRGESKRGQGMILFTDNIDKIK